MIPSIHLYGLGAGEGLSFSTVTTAVDNLLTIVGTMVTTIFNNPVLAVMAVSGLVFTGIKVWKKLKRA